MAAAEIYDYLTTITPDYSSTSLTITAQGEVTEESSTTQVIHYCTDNSEERISFGSNKKYTLAWSWNYLSESDSGTILDFYNDSTKANGCQNSFYLSYGDGHTYVVRFNCSLTRAGTHPSRYGIPDIRLDVLGRKED